MNELPQKDRHHVTAARGWLELGNDADANRELDAVTPAFRVHPDVLEVRWQICAHRKMWIAAFEIASAICELDPDRSFGWVHQAFALNEMDRTLKACEILRDVVDRFPALPIIPYSLACYTCRLGRLGEAWQWLEKAIESGGRNQIAQLALDEPDLKPLWRRLRIKLAERTPAVRRDPAKRSNPGVPRLVTSRRPKPLLGKKTNRRFRFSP